MTATRWWIILGIVILPFLVFPGFGEEFITVKAVMLSLLCSVALLSVGWLVVTHGDKELITRWLCSPAVWGSSFFLMMALVVWGAQGAHSQSFWGLFLRSQGVWFTIMIVIFSIIGLMVFHSQTQWNKLWWWVSGSAVLLVFVEMLARVGLRIPFVAGQGSFSSFLGNSSFFAGYLLIALWALYALWSRAQSTKEKISIGLICVVLFCGILWTQSRAAMLSVIISVVIASVLWFRTRYKIDRVLTTKTKWVGGAAAIVVLLYVVAQLPMFSGVLPRALVIDPGALTSQTRVLHWKSGITAFAQKPLLGWGIGNYATGAAAYVSDEIFALSSSDTVVDDPHNVFLRRFVEGGILLGVAYCALYLSVLWSAFRLFKQNGAEGRRDAILLVVAVFGYATYSFFSIEHIVVELGFWTIIGWAIFRDMQTQPEKNVEKQRLPLEKLVGYGSGGVGLVGLIVTVLMLPNTVRSYEINSAIAHKQWFTWSENIESLSGAGWQPYACAVWDQQTVNWLSLSALENNIVPYDIFISSGVALSKTASVCDEGRDMFLTAWRAAQLDTRLSGMTIAVSRQQAQDLWEQLIAQAPKQMYLHFGLVESYLSAAEYDRAATHLEELREQYPTIPQIYEMLLLVYKITGDTDRAAQVELLRSKL